MAILWTEENALQESVNAWIHGIAFIISLPCGIALNQIAVEHRASLVYACLTYSLSLTALYLFSTLSHAVRDPQWRSKFRAWDQGLVYTLIAGTFTPFAWSYLDGWKAIAILFFVWIAAAAGFYSKVVARHRLDNMTAIYCILLGWIPSMILLGFVSTPCFATLALGGILYSVGTLFLMNDHRSRYFHAVWHLMVILASACHYIAIVVFIILQVDHHQ